MNGKGEWIKFLGGWLMAGLVSYFTAQAVIRERVAVLETQSAERWEYVKSSLARIESRQTQSDAEFRRVMQDWVNGYERRTGEPLPLQRGLEGR